MMPHELMEIAVDISTRFDTHWTLFITVHLALIGGIVYIDKPLKMVEKIIAITVYLGFAVANYMMMSAQALFLDGVYRDIAIFHNQECCVGSHAIEYIANLVESNFRSSSLTFIRISHALMIVIVAVSFFYEQSAADKNNSTTAE